MSALAEAEHQEEAVISPQRGEIRDKTGQLLAVDVVHYDISVSPKIISDPEMLADRLHSWQWPDGGWNCDKNPHAHHSSYMESIIPLRALELYARITGDQNAAEAAKRAAEIFLKRHLFLRQSSGSVITPGFLELHYPLYWHYDILGGLKVMAECGFICDPRCEAALNVLIEKQLPDGGWAAEKKYYKLC